MDRDTLEKMIFECQQCGACCHGQTTVSLDETDQGRMASYMGMSVEELKERYLRVSGKVVQMRVEDGHCVFYKQGCTVHPGKPWRCGQWPLHPSILADFANFQAISTSCPGIKKELGYEEFCRIFSEYLHRKDGG